MFNVGSALYQSKPTYTKYGSGKRTESDGRKSCKCVSFLILMPRLFVSLQQGCHAVEGVLGFSGRTLL